jgi:hypothetical protein
MNIDAVYLKDRMIKEEGFHVYNMYYIVKKHFSISIAPLRSWGGSLVMLQKKIKQ